MSRRVLAPGICLFKKFEKYSSGNTVGTITLEIESSTIQVVDIELSLEESENLEILGSSSKDRVNLQILPFEKKKLAVIQLYRKYKLKQKFKINYSVPNKELQEKFVINYDLKTDVKKCKESLRKIPVDFLDDKQIGTQLINNNIQKFIDSEFIPCDEILLDPKSGYTVQDSFEYLIHWKRPEEFILLDSTPVKKSDLKIFNGRGPQPNDMYNIGILANKKTMSVLSGLAEMNQLVERLIQEKSISDFGVYHANLWIKGNQKTITIDDLFPCIPMSNPISTRSASTEIWVLILEKALAKITGNYYDLSFKTIIDYLLVLTGCPTFYHLIPPQNNEYLSEEEYYSDLTEKLENFVNKKKYLTIATSIDRSNEEEEENDITFLEPDTGYTILSVIKYIDRTYVKLRNIWINDEDSEQSIANYQQQLFEENPTLQKEYEDSTLIFPIEEFSKQFLTLAVCYTREWEQVSLKGEFIKSKEDASSLYESFYSKYFYEIRIERKTNLIISLFQDEDSNKDSETEKDSIKPIMDISISILKYDKALNEISHIQTVDFNFSSSYQLETNLDSGVYFIIPRSSGCYLTCSKIRSKMLIDKYGLYNYDKGEISQLFKSVAKEIFEKYEDRKEGLMSPQSFANLYETMTNNELTNYDYKNTILNKYQNYDNCLTEQGLIQFFEESYTQQGDKIIKGWLKKLGYDENLRNTHYRNFNLIVYSEEKISVFRKEIYGTKLNSKLNKILLKHFGDDMGEKIIDEALKTLFIKSNLSNVFTLGYSNLTYKDISVIVDLSNAKGISVLNKKMEKLIKKNDTEFICQFIYNGNLEDIDLKQFKVEISTPY